MKKILMSLLLAITLISCASPQLEGETERVFKSIVKEKYVLDTNDCSNKSAKFLDYLLSKGKKADIAVFATNNPEMLHAVVHSEGTYYCLTSGMVTRNPRTISKYVTRGLYLFTVKKGEFKRVIFKTIEGRKIMLFPSEWEYTKK